MLRCVPPSDTGGRSDTRRRFDGTDGRWIQRIVDRRQTDAERAIRSDRPTRRFLRKTQNGERHGAGGDSYRYLQSANEVSFSDTDARTQGVDGVRSWCAAPPPLAPLPCCVSRTRLPRRWVLGSRFPASAPAFPPVLQLPVLRRSTRCRLLLRRRPARHDTGQGQSRQYEASSRGGGHNQKFLDDQLRTNYP